MRLCLSFLIFCFALSGFSSTHKPFEEWSEEEQQKCVQSVFVSFGELLACAWEVERAQAEENFFTKENVQLTLKITEISFSPNKAWGNGVIGVFSVSHKLIGRHENDEKILISDHGVGNFYGLQEADLPEVVAYWQNQNPQQHQLVQGFEIKVEREAD